MEKINRTCGRTYAHHAPKKTFKWGRYVLGAVVLFVLRNVFSGDAITPPASITIEQGDTLQSFLKPLTAKDRFWTKWYLRKATVDTTKLQTGVYAFSGSYTPAAYIDAIMAGPPKDYSRVTILEGWSIYDIDAQLTKKSLITAGEFIALAQDTVYISELSKTFPFLAREKSLTTLEGFLYPDTYFLGNNSDPKRQLIQAALKRFDEKIMSLRRREGSSFLAAASQQGVKLSLPGAISLASVIEKEERNSKAKPMIAGIFLNRLAQNIQLGADITLCYGYKEPYETCTTSRIVGGLRDSENIYNTRVRSGLTPTPISSVSDVTFGALLRYQKNDNLFYLHDAQGGIHYAKTNAEHEQNKAQYLQ